MLKGKHKKQLQAMENITTRMQTKRQCLDNEV